MPEKALQDLKTELVLHYRWLRQYGCNDSHSGNASFRWHDQIWITPTGCCADTLDEADLIPCNIRGDIGEGASLDASLHLASYQKNPTTRAIIHSHGAHAIAMTLNNEKFVPVDFEGQYYFPTVPVIHIKFTDYLSLSPQKVAAALADHKVVIVAGHGVYSGAPTINLAYKWSCSLELSAKIAWLAAQRN